ncbi:MAG: PKD domain-containing protein, partial [Anaerolineae bacterium]|nr:PKD domain-containing protein [Anaerolineae bacterium]
AVGIYTPVVTASNSVVDVVTTTVVTITDAPILTLTATNDSPTILGSVTTLTATAAPSTNVTYTWALGDGTCETGAVVTHTYPAVGIYTPVVTASNSVSEVVTTTVVTITDVPILTLTATNDSPTALGLPTLFTATIAAGSNVSYTWEFQGGEHASGAMVSYTYPVVGWYTAVVTASNSASQLTATTGVRVLLRIYLPLVIRPGTGR